MQAPTVQTTMPYYVPATLPPPSQGTRSRGSSNGSRYVPDAGGYPISATNDVSEAYPAPTRRMSLSHEPRPFTPSRPEQYRSSGEYQRQLRPPGPDASLGFVPTPDGYVRPAYGTRYSRAGSVDSRNSHRSHRSAHSHHSHASGRPPRSSRESERERGKHHHHHHHSETNDERRRERRRQEREEDEMDLKPIKRVNTNRPTLGGSLISLWDNIKSAAKGY